MWLIDPEEFAELNGLTVQQALRLKCTAEHRLARQDGGTDCEENIAAACWPCNFGRHARKFALDFEEFSKHVRNKIRMCRWHPRWVHETGLIASEATIVNNRETRIF
jgi:hypothetical protein